MKKKVVVTMANFPPRRAGLLPVVETMLPQCDILCLYLNGYDEVPEELPESDKLEIVLAGPNTGNPDKGSQGKHHWLDKYGDCYYLTVDDDIFYPCDYVAEMVAAIDKYSCKAIITVHGTSYRLDGEGRIPTGNLDRAFKTYYPYSKGYPKDIYVHMCGNACTGCCPSEIGMTCAVSVGGPHSGDDNDYALFSQANSIPIVRMATPSGWLTANNDIWPIMAQHKDMEKVKMRDAKARSWQHPWLLFPGEIAAKRIVEHSGPEPLITVSMTTCDTPPKMLRQAVDGVLNQTERRIRLVVVNDAGNNSCWSAIDDIDDPRLQRLDMPFNVGTYGCHAEILRRCDTPWWSPHDSDDWCKPDRYANILAAAQEDDDVVLGGYTNIDKNGNLEERMPYPSPRGCKMSRHLVCRSVWAGGLWKTEWLRKAGGINGSYRVGYDSVLQVLALKFSKLKAIDDAGYMRLLRENSLMRDPVTGVGSEYRKLVCQSFDENLDIAMSKPSLEEAGAVMGSAQFF